MIKVNGVHSDKSLCECCGKNNLKRVVNLTLEDGRTVDYGTTCAAKALRANYKLAISDSLMLDIAKLVELLTLKVNKYGVDVALRFAQNRGYGNSDIVNDKLFVRTNGLLLKIVKTA